MITFGKLSVLTTASSLPRGEAEEDPEVFIMHDDRLDTMGARSPAERGESGDGYMDNPKARRSWLQRG